MNKNKYILFIMLCFSFLTITGCNINSNIPSKTEFSISENAIIDHYTVICNNFKKIKQYDGNSGYFLKVNYEVTNNSSGDSTINLKEQFKLYLEDGTMIDAINNENIYLSSKGNKSFEVIFEIDEKLYNAERYKILYYSGVVSNNIAFIID